MSKRIWGMVLCSLAMVTVGSTVVVSKWIAHGLPPFTATALRFGLALPVLVLLMRFTHTPWPRPDRHDQILLLCQAGVGSVGYTVLLILGLRWTPAADAGVVSGVLPAVTALVAVLALRERLGPFLVAGIGLATAGVLIIMFPSLVGMGAGAVARPMTVVWGQLLVLGSVVCEALFILLNKRLRVAVQPLALSTLMVAGGLGLSGLPALLERAWLQPIPSTALAAVAYYALVPTVLGFLLWFAGAARLRGAEAALLTALAPVSALVLAALFLGEPVGWVQMAGAACVLVAVGLTALDGARREQRSRPVGL